MIEPLLEPANTPVVDTEYTLARLFLGVRMKDTAPPDGGNWTTGKVLKHLHQPLEAVASVVAALRHADFWCKHRTL